MARTRLKYSKDIHEKACTLAESGHTDAEICQALGIGQSTFYRWKRQHPELGEDLIKAKYKLNMELEATAFKRANGYMTEEEKTIIAVEDGIEEVIRIEKVKKHVPADTKLLMALLRNRMPEKYKEVEKKQVEITGGLNLQLDTLTDDELDKEIEKLL